MADGRTTNSERIAELERKIDLLLAERGGDVGPMTGEERIRSGMTVRSIEDFLIEKLNAKYAQRIFQKINTEWEKLTISGNTEPGLKEYEWMVQRALEIHKKLNFSEEEKDEKSAED